MTDRHQLCADMNHPGVTYNPLYNRTWCLCGAVIPPATAPSACSAANRYDEEND